MAKKKNQLLEIGDHVAWNTPQGKTEGEIVAKHTKEAKAGGHTAVPSPEEPQFEVKSAKTGKTAIHKPAALSKAPKKSRGR